MKKVVFSIVALLLIAALFGCSVPGTSSILPEKSEPEIVTVTPEESESVAPGTPAVFKVEEPDEPSAEPSPSVTPENLQVDVGQSVFRVWKTYSIFQIHIACELINNGNVAAEIETVSFSMLDKDGNILGVYEAYPVPYIIQPGEYCYAETTEYLDSVKSEKDVAKIEISPSVSVSLGNAELFKLENIKYFKKAGKITGYVTNTLPENAESIQIAFGLYDKNKKLIGVMNENVDIKLEPGKKGAFSISYPDIGPGKVYNNITEVRGLSFNSGY